MTAPAVRFAERRRMWLRHVVAGAIVALGLAVASAVSAQATDAHAEAASANAALVHEAFEAWREGRGSVFDLLADDVEWTVAGHSPVSGTYRSRAAFMDDAVQPIVARLATPIVPEVRHVVARGDDVVVFWRGRATTHDGSAYENDYAWHLVLQDGRIVRATAFLDTWALDRLMRDRSDANRRNAP